MPASSKPLKAIDQDVPLGVYIHWPFCEAKCPYCDFNSHVRKSIDEDAFLRAYLKELETFKDKVKGGKTASIFFGGGTPSLMPPAITEQIISKIFDLFPAATTKPEITLEANPGSVEAGKFQDFKAAGINRVSIGVQSLHDDVLKSLGRVHSREEALKAVKLAKTTFDRISFDLIYARQNQTLKEWERELAEALELAENHLSLYQLTIEQGTAYYQQYKRGTLVLPDEDLSADMFDLTQEMTEKAGLPAYEISNHAKPGEESRHNMIYWQGIGYLGIGPGAHGRIPQSDGRSFAHNQLQKPESWLKTTLENGHGTEDAFFVEADDRAVEMIMMGLRLSRGISAEIFNTYAGQQIEDVIDINAAVDLVAAGLVEMEVDDKGDNRVIKTLRLTRAGRPLLNSILRNLL